MEFGKVTNTQLNTIDFAMPPTPARTWEQLRKSTKKPLKVWAGCPVWANKDWVGSLYPTHAKSQDFLKHYTQQFNTIELNLTHYKIPDDAMIARWLEQTAEGFVFCPKILQEISHQVIMKKSFEPITLEFCTQILKLGEHLGISFLQLPPYFSPEYFEHLEDFLAFFPVDIPLAVEFRNPQWFKEKTFEKAVALLEKYNCHTVITDVAGRRDVLHLYLSSTTFLLRFVGNNLHPTDYERIDAWVKTIGEWQKEGLEQVYFFAHEPENTFSPLLARYFIEQMNLHCHTNIPLPINLKEKEEDLPQGNLF